MSEVYEFAIEAEGEARDADGNLLDADGNPIPESAPDAEPNDQSEEQA